MKDTFILCKDWINYVNELTEKDQSELLLAIFKYQNGEEVENLSYGVKICFSHIKDFRKKQDEKYLEIVEKRRESGKKGGRPTDEKAKKANALSKSKGKQTEAKKANESKQNLTETDTVITTSNDVVSPNGDMVNSSTPTFCFLIYSMETGQFVENIIEYENYGNEEVEKVMQMVSNANDGVMDGSKARNRQYANLLIKKLKEEKSVSEGKMSWEQLLSIILALMRDDKYHSGKITSPENIYYHSATLLTECRKKFIELKNKQTKKDGFRTF